MIKPSSRKHILFLINDLTGGDAEKALAELLKRFDYDRCEVTLCLCLRTGVYLEELPEQVRVVALGRHERSFFYRVAMHYCYRHDNPLPLAWLMRLRLRFRYDAIVSFKEGMPLFLHSLILGRGRRNITWVHCDLSTNHYCGGHFYGTQTQEECYREMDDVVFVSPGGREGFARKFQIKASLRSISNVVDTQQIRRLAGENPGTGGPFTITAVGSLCAVKGFDRLIRVAKMLRDEGCDFRVRILGEGDKREELTKLRDRLGLKEEVKIPGFVKQPYALLRESDLLVSTSVSEGYPYAIAEALALGVPVVATPTNGAVELLDGGKYGVLTGHADESVFRGIKSLLDDPGLKARYGSLALERSRIFDVGHTMEQVYNLLEGAGPAGR